MSLTSPDGNTVGLFADIGSSTAGSQTGMNIGLDDDAASPPRFTAMTGMIYQPDINYRQGWFKGQQAQGTWTLTLRDDLATNGGTLNGWSLEVVDENPLPPGSPLVVYSSDFEADGGGFTHSGFFDEWQRGLPSLAPITTANSGANCWKTDLAGNFGPGAGNGDHDLLSPNIDLTAIAIRN